MKIFSLCVLVLVIAASHSSVAAHGAGPTSPLALFQSRYGWASLDVLYLDLLASKFKTVDEALAFAELCERSAILKTDIQAQSSSVAAQNSQGTIVSTAAALNKYGSRLGSDREFGQAIEAFRFAILLNGQLVPSHIGLASSHAERHDYLNAVAVLDASPKTMTVGADTIDFAFDLAFQKMMVLAAAFGDSRASQDQVALIAQMNATKTLGQNPISESFLEDGIHGEDAVAGRRDRLLFIEKYLSKFALVESALPN